MIRLASIRELTYRDRPAIASMILTTWDMDSYGEGLGIPTSEAYLQSCIRNSRFIRVLEDEDGVKGCVMARAGRNRIRFGEIADAFRFGGRIHGMDGIDSFLSDIRILNDTDRKLKRECGMSFDGELVLLIVSEDSRGKGYGKMLFESAEGYFREHGAQDILIFTDDDCGYGFYDRLGARRLATRDVRLVNEDLRMMAYHYIVK